MTLTDPLAHRIAQRINACGGWVGFDVFMQEALYCPGLGYYSGRREPFGPQGDFVTAPMMGPWFAGVIWDWAAPLFAVTGPQIREFGGGQGGLAAQLLELSGGRCQIEMIELSGTLRATQQEATQGFDSIRWSDQLHAGFQGLVLANEVLDAMPVKVFVWNGFEAAVPVEERGVAWSPQGFVWANRPAGPELWALVNARAVAALNRGRPWPSGYQGEHAVALTAWITSLAQSMDRGAALLVDYGFAQTELDHPGRANGTLCVHHRHRRVDDPDHLLLRVGEQDLTAHVNFSAVARAAASAGFQVQGFCTQGRFLTNAGILDQAQRRLKEIRDPAHGVTLMRHLQTLITESEMGEQFKVILLTKNLDDEVVSRLITSGFAAGDRLESLRA
jgi:SAM-dependent MidA family methyltransferase